MRSLFQTAIGRFGATLPPQPVKTVAEARIDVVVGKFALGGSSSLVLLDLALERSDAFDVLEHLAQIGFAGRIVPMSGQDDAVLNHLEEFGVQLNLEMLPALRKPFRADQLRMVVAAHAEHRNRPVKIDLAKTLQSESLLVWYQPRVDLRTYKMWGFEAVVRVDHPADGLLLPERFVGQLTDQETRLVTLHMVREIVTLWENLADKDLILKPSLRMRAQDLASGEMIDLLKELRPRDKRWPGIVAKITDAHVLNELPDIRKALVRTRIHHMQLSLEDVAAVNGVVALPDLKFSEITLNRRFVLGSGRDTEKSSVLKEIVAFARKTQLTVVAEGVETVEDLSALKKIDVFRGQGTLFSSAVPQASLQALAVRAEPLWQDPPPH